MAEICWIEAPPPGGLAVMPRPRGGDWLEDEVREFRKERVDVVASLLEPEEAARFDLAHEGGVCEAAGIEFLSLPIPDHDVPGADAPRFVEGLVRRYRQGRRIAVHCFGGLGRAPTIAAAVLVDLGLPVEETLRRISEARGFPVPEMPEQRAWIFKRGGPR
jgi:protein-tyrosine phosphatase